MTTQETALNGTVEIVKNWLSKGVSSEIAILKPNRIDRIIKKNSKISGTSSFKLRASFK